MSNSYLWDLLASLSLANLSFLPLWDGLLNYTPAQAFFLERAPPPAEYAAAFVNIFLVGLVFFLLIRLARGSSTGLVSIPILILIALPAAKSFLRLIANRYPAWDLRAIAGTLAFLFAAAVVVVGRRSTKVAAALLVALSPLIAMEGMLSVLKCWSDPSAFADGPLAAHIRQPLKPRIVWIIFDDLDYRLSFLDRPADTLMPEFDRLRKVSLFAEDAHSPAPFTALSVPSLWTQKQLSSVEALGPSSILFDRVPARTQPNIFSTARALGANVAVVGWYFPYCRLFSQDLVSCSAHAIESGFSESGLTFQENFRDQIERLFAYGNRSLLGSSPRARRRIAMLSAVHREALSAITDPSLNLVFLHLPVPHAPYIFDRFSHTFPKRYLGAGDYLDNLALADIYLGDFREAMTSAALWDRTTVLVTSDHPDSGTRSIDGKTDPRVPFLLKLAGQNSGLTYKPVLRTVVTKELVESILEGKITSSQDAGNWLTEHSK